MNNINKEMKDGEGNTELLEINSSDNYSVDLKWNYVLANRNYKNENKFVKKFKNSVLGSEIGVKNSGFTSVAILATVISISVILVLYFMWRF